MALPPLHAFAAAIDRYNLPGEPTAANLAGSAGTDTVPFHRPCSAYYAGGANEPKTWLADLQ